MKLRYFLALIFFVVALSPVLLFRAWPHSTVLENEMDEVHERHLLLAQNIAAALERYHRDVSSTFSLLVTNTTIWREAPELARILTNLDMRHVCIVDASSGRVVAKLELAQRPCPSVIRQPLLDKLKSYVVADQITFGEVSAALDGENVIHIVKPLPDNRIAVGSISTRYFRDLGAAISFGVNGHAAIVDHAGNVLSHPRPDWVAERRNIAKVPAVKRMMRGETGVEIFYTPAFDADMIAGFTTVQPVGWGVMIPQPMEELTAKAEVARHSAMLVLLVGVAGSLIFALFLSFLMAQPLEEVTRATRQAAKGKLVLPRVPSSVRVLPREFGELLHGFRNMIVRLRESTAKINALAFVDAITGLANREYFRRSVDAYVDHANLDDQASMMFLDLDGFKAVNDTKGHDVGDFVLEELSKRICTVLDVPLFAETNPDETEIVSKRRNIQVARLGGDEFAVFLPGVDSSTALNIAKSLLRSIEAPIRHNNSNLSLSASIGVATFPNDAQDCPGLLKCSDTAMYESKRAGKNQVSRYSGSVPQQDSRKKRLADDLFSKNVGTQMEMQYQPVYDASALTLASVECLIRWRHPEEGLLGPEDFFEAAAELGLMRQIDKMVVSRARIAADQAAELGIVPTLFSMNLSMERLIDRAFVDRLIDHRPTESPIAIELTQSSLLDALDSRAAWSIDRLKEAGTQVCLDDFGAAHASMSSLLDLGPTIIKLDGHLVSRAAPGNEISCIIRSINQMAHDLGITVVAKGIESINQVALLNDLGCDQVQGYALNRPLSQVDLFALLKGSAVRDSA